MAVLFGTPAFCQTRTCGPVLDVLLSQRDAFSDRVHLLHVETQPQATTYAPALSAYHLEFEPIGDVRLKGFSESTELFIARAAETEE